MSAVPLAGRVLATMVPAALFGADSLSGASSPFPRVGCLRCHEPVMSGAVRVRGLSIDHRSCGTERSCSSCHGRVSHPDATRWQRDVVMEDCVACHREKEAGTECDSCHDGKRESERLSAGPWQVTHGKNWTATHGMGSLTYCGTCHPDDYCVRCHETPLPHASSWGGTHGAAARTSDKGCLVCHSKTQLCDPCHGTEMPHPSGFLKQHSKIAGTASNPACFRCHAEDDCGNCHANHIHPGYAKTSMKEAGK